MTPEGFLLAFSLGFMCGLVAAIVIPAAVAVIDAFERRYLVRRRGR